MGNHMLSFRQRAAPLYPCWVCCGNFDLLTFVITMLDADVSLRDVQIAARHAERITMRYDRARKSLDRRPNYILAAYMASGT